MTAATAIDIGSHSLKWVRVRDLGGRPILEAWGRRNLPHGTLSGNFNKLALRRPADFSRLLGELVNEAGLVRSEAAVTFPDQYVKIFFAELDRLQDLTEAERRYTVWRLRQQLPSSLVSECVLDYQHLQTIRRSEHGPIFRLLVEAVREDVINELARRIADLRVWPASFCANSFCAYNLYSDYLEERIPDETTLCFMHIGGFTTTFLFFKNGILEYVRVLDYAWNDFVERLMSATGTDRDSAISRLQEEEFLPSGHWSLGEGLGKLGLFRTLFEEWFREIESTFQFHKNKHPYLGRPVVRICGGGSVLRNLTAFLSGLLGGGVEILEPSLVVDIPGSSSGEGKELVDLSAAVGAALTCSGIASSRLTAAERTGNSLQGEVSAA